MKKKYKMLMMLLMLVSLALATAAQADFAGIIPPQAADTSIINTACVEPWDIVNERCNGDILFYEQCIPGINQHTWGARSINCEVRHGIGYTCQSGQCAEDKGIFTGVNYYLMPFITLLVVGLIIYLVYKRQKVIDYLRKKGVL